MSCGRLLLPAVPLELPETGDLIHTDFVDTALSTKYMFGCQFREFKNSFLLKTRNSLREFNSVG